MRPLVVLAQVACRVPAVAARIGLVDAIFAVTRLSLW